MQKEKDQASQQSRRHGWFSKDKATLDDFCLCRLGKIFHLSKQLLLRAEKLSYNYREIPQETISAFSVTVKFHLMQLWTAARLMQFSF